MYFIVSPRFGMMIYFLFERSTDLLSALVIYRRGRTRLVQDSAHNCHVTHHRHAQRNIMDVPWHSYLQILLLRLMSFLILYRSSVGYGPDRNPGYIGFDRLWSVDELVERCFWCRQSVRSLKRTLEGFDYGLVRRASEA